MRFAVLALIACLPAAAIGGINIIDAQEHSDATGKLLTYDAGLLVAVGTRQQNSVAGPS
jgi:hypothetical protein